MVSVQGLKAYNQGLKAYNNQLCAGWVVLYISHALQQAGEDCFVGRTQEVP